MVTIINQDNSKWKLIYDKYLLLLDKTNKLSFDVNLEAIFRCKINFVFSEEGDQYQANFSISEDGRTLDILLHKWNSTSDLGFIENTQPLKLTTNGGKKIAIKYRTQTNEKTNWRNFHISIWYEEEENV